MRQITLEPIGWMCSLKECRPGPLVYFDDDKPRFAFKSEYQTDSNRIEVFNEAGEYLVNSEEFFVQAVDIKLEEV